MAYRSPGTLQLRKSPPRLESEDPGGGAQVWLTCLIPCCLSCLWLSPKMVMVVDATQNTTGSASSSDEPASVRPPTVTSPPELPFRDLYWKTFERLCQDIVRDHGFEDVHRYGIQGQSEDGVDFVGVSPEGVRTAFQARQVASLSGADLKAAVRAYAEGRFAPPETNAFVVCLSVEGNESKLQQALREAQQTALFRISLWDSPELTHRLRTNEGLVQTYFGEGWVARFFSESSSQPSRLDAQVLLLGPVEAYGLTAKVEEAQRLAETCPADAARVYGEIAGALRNGAPGHAERFEQMRATSLEEAGDPVASHDVLMELALRNLFSKAEPRLPPGIAASLRRLEKKVDEVRQVRGAAVGAFTRWHEHPEALDELASHFDRLGPDDQYAPFVAVLLAEAGVADRTFEVVQDRKPHLQRVSEGSDGALALRIRLALADVSDSEAWRELIDQVESSQFSDADGAYVCLRAGRWCAWNGDFDEAEQHYRRAVQLATNAEFDLDVVSALWSLQTLYAFRNSFGQLDEANRLALSIDGKTSYVALNSRSSENSYRHLAKGQMPGAHLWSRYRLLESVRSGCLTDELESHATLAQIYAQVGEPLEALEHATLAGSGDRAKEVALQVRDWPDFLTGLTVSPAPWVRSAGLSALERLGDVAPPEVARQLAHDLAEQLGERATDIETAPGLAQALVAVVLEASHDDLERLLPILEQAARRVPGNYLLTDRGVGMLAARAYRFRPALRQRASAILGEMATGHHTNEWSRTLSECGDDVGDLVAAFEVVAEREGMDLAGPFSDLGHLNAATRTLWLRRLESVAEHPLGGHSQHSLGTRYDIPPTFLQEQEASVVDQYIAKLVAIGSDPHEALIHRAAALESAANAVNLVSPEKRRELFEVVRPLIDQRIPTSDLDDYHAKSLHPLSSVRFSLGSVADVRASALWFLGQTAAGSNDGAVVIETALRWIRSDVETLQRAGAAALTLPTLPSMDVGSDELAAHTNFWVRRVALELPSFREQPEESTLELLTSDPHTQVRVAVAYALSRIGATAPDSHERYCSSLRADKSAIVRAIAADVLDPVR